MATYTDYLHLCKPETTDTISPGPFNDNANILDNSIKNLDTYVNKLKDRTDLISKTATVSRTASGTFQSILEITGLTPGLYTIYAIGHHDSGSYPGMTSQIGVATDDTPVTDNDVIFLGSSKDGSAAGGSTTVEITSKFKLVYRFVNSSTTVQLRYILRYQKISALI